MPNRRLFILAALAGMTAPSWAFAHVALSASRPAQGGTVSVAGFDLELRFSGRIDARRSRGTLTLADGTSRAMEFLPGDDPATARAHVAALPPGPCELRYTMLSTDGHMSSGTLRFSAAEP